MIEGQQTSKEWDDMAEREENVVELGAWLEWEMQQIKLEAALGFYNSDQSGEFKNLKDQSDALRCAHLPSMLQFTNK